MVTGTKFQTVAASIDGSWVEHAIGRGVGALDLQRAQHISRDHLHTAHGSGEGAHDGGDDIKGTYAEQQLLWERRKRRRLLEQQKERRKSGENKRNDKGAREKVRRRREDSQSPLKLGGVGRFKDLEPVNPSTHAPDLDCPAWRDCARFPLDFCL
ncbi:hypothetical protein EYF80_003155 [Liparis tanakae]|uniref:Uncharacterized protein n=1 Tax=Liparis tanakae TaxID=230148 RepID=A0A4Z2J9H0_9TELE|nr:hypothetical protein EYF80_003155 [Liparis tanakae]